MDDYESPQMMAYILSKPLKTGMMYSDHGVYKFVLQEVTATVNDNFELRIADYYKYFPKSSGDTSANNTDDPSDDEHTETSGESDTDTSNTERKVWL